MSLSFEDFKVAFPSQKKVTAQNFPEYLMRAETVVQDLMVYAVDDLTEAGIAVYDAAVGLQIDYAATEGGFTEGNLASQTVNGVSQSFALTAAGADAVKVSPLAAAKLRSNELCVRG